MRASLTTRVRRRIGRRAAWLAAALFRHPRPGRPHGLGGPLIVSLTSYPPRYGSLHLTLRCLLSQSVQPDHVILWIAEADMSALPHRVLKLRGHGLTIRSFPRDIKSYKKLVPVLKEWPDAYILTADDDCGYPTDWVARYVAAARTMPGAIHCLRARQHGGSRPADTPYMSWQAAPQGATGPTIVPIGVGGILYPGARSLDARATDEASFQSLAPTADDLWFYWMARLADTAVHVIDGQRVVFGPWPSNRRGPTLFEINGPGGANDRQIGKLSEALPLPRI